jgi:predicted phosphodiesterase
VESSNCIVSWETAYEDTSVVRIIKEGLGWLQDFLLLSDVHFDSTHCDRKLLKALLDEAVERGAPIVIFGDWYDAMQGREDPRRNKDELGEEYKTGQYLDWLVMESFYFLEPYKEHIVLIAEGNHDSAIRRKLETDLIWRLARELGVMHMGYSGFMLFLFSHPKGNHRCRKELFYHHGSGGGGEVTKGTMRAQRQAAWATADIYVGGHIHEAWRMNQRRLLLTNNGKPIITDMLHVCIPALKDEFNLRGGYHVEKGRPPKPIGAFWLRFYRNPRKHGNIAFDALIAD